MAFARREEKNTFCIPNLCGLNIAKDAILTGPEAEFLSVENRQNPREWKCRVFFSMQSSSALEVTILNEVAQSSVSSLLAVDHQYWHQLLPLLVWKIKLSLLVAQEDRSYSSGSAVLVSFLFFFVFTWVQYLIYLPQWCCNTVHTLQAWNTEQLALKNCVRLSVTGHWVRGDSGILFYILILIEVSHFPLFWIKVFVALGR